MKKRLIALSLAMLVVATVFSANTTLKTANAQGPNSNRGVPGTIIGPNGKILKRFLSVSCANPSSGETRKEKGWQKDKSGKDVVGDVNVSSQLKMDCPSSTAPQVSSGGTAITALASWQWWICSGSEEKDTLLGMNYKTTLTQWFQTSPYTNIVWSPPSPSVTVQTGLGWNLDGNPTATGPIPYSYFSPGVVSQGLSMGSAQFKYPILWWNFQTASQSIALVFRYGSCTWYKS